MKIGTELLYFLGSVEKPVIESENSRNFKKVRGLKWVDFEETLRAQSLGITNITRYNAGTQLQFDLLSLPYICCWTSAWRGKNHLTF